MTPEAFPDVSFALFAGVGLVLAVAGVAAWWLRARSTGEVEGVIRLVSVRPLGGKRLLALVEVEKQHFLLGMTDERISCLGIVPVSTAELGPRGEQRVARKDVA
jgi:flagellar biogenesis protein FliO